MSLASAFAPAEAHYKAQVYAETFGHLAPTPRQTYEGWMVLTWAGYGGDLIVISAEWKDLDDSPWLFDDMQDYLGKLTENNRAKRGEVYKFVGTYTKFKNGNYRFSGKLQRIPIERHLIGM
jgi:hypothetical protein